MKKYILILMLLALWCNVYSGNKRAYYSIGARVSYPHVFNINFTTILIPGKETSTLFHSSVGINSARIGIGFGDFDPKWMREGESFTINYLTIYNDMWIKDELINRSFLGFEMNRSNFLGALDLGVYYSIDKDKKGTFLFVWGIGFNL